jgi:peptide deformylase
VRLHGICPIHGPVSRLDAIVGAILAQELASAILSYNTFADVVDSFESVMDLDERSYVADVAGAYSECQKTWGYLQNNPQALAIAVRDSESLTDEGNELNKIHLSSIFRALESVIGREVREEEHSPPRPKREVCLDRSLAADRACRLLLEFLTPRQRSDLLDTGSFKVHSESGRAFRLIFALHGNVIEFEGARTQEVKVTYCGNFGGGQVPLADNLLAQLFALSGDAQKFLDVANKVEHDHYGFVQVEEEDFQHIRDIAGATVPLHRPVRTRVQFVDDEMPDCTMRFTYHRTRGVAGIRVPQKFQESWREVAHYRRRRPLSSYLKDGWRLEADLLHQYMDCCGSSLVTTRGLMKAENRIIALDLPNGRRTTFANPCVVDQSSKYSIVSHHSDLCPHLKGSVLRPTRTCVAYTDIHGDSRVIELEGRMSHTILKAIEELDGITLTDTCLPFSMYWAPAGKESVWRENLGGIPFAQHIRTRMERDFEAYNECRERYRRVFPVIDWRAAYSR